MPRPKKSEALSNQKPYHPKPPVEVVAEPPGEDIVAEPPCEDKQLKEKALDAMRNLFYNLHYTVTSNSSFLDYEKLAAVDVCKGVNVGTLQHTDDAAKTMLMFAVDRWRPRLIERINRNKSPFSILLDESTDKTSQKHLCLLIRFGYMKRSDILFYRLINLEDGCDAKTITEAIVKQFKDDGISDEALRNNLVGLGADGAAVIAGHVSGIGKRLKDLYPKLQRVHCAAHRNDLVLQDVFKSKAPGMSYAQEIMKQVKDAGIVFNYPAAKALIRKKLSEADYNAMTAYKRVVPTRWVGHFVTALKAYINNVPTTLKLMQHKFDYAAIPSIKKFVNNLDNLLKCSAFLDVIKILNELNLFAQKKDADVQLLTIKIRQTKEELRSLSLSTQLSNEMQLLVRRLSVPAGTLDDEKLFKPKDQKTVDKATADAVQFRRQVSDFIVQHLDERFPDNELIGWFEALTAPLPRHDRITKLLNLAEVFEVPVAEGFATTEDQINHELDVPLRDHSENNTPLLQRLTEIMYALPPSSAECERVFSRLVKIKTADRNLLAVSTLDAAIYYAFNHNNLMEFSTEVSALVHAWYCAGQHLPIPISRATSFRRKRAIKNTT